MTQLQFAQSKPFDILCVGRAGVDFYALDKETDFQKANRFHKSIGGSPANVATQLARLGKQVGILTALSDDMLGKYVHHFFTEENISDEFIQWQNAGVRTSLAVTETKQHDCEVVIYRNNAADLQIETSQIDFESVKKYKVIFVTGTALSQSPSRETVLNLVEFARQNQIRVIFDLDYRAYSWQDEAETAYYYHLVAQNSDIIIGNTEEWVIFENLDGKKTRNNIEAISIGQHINYYFEARCSRLGNAYSKRAFLYIAFCSAKFETLRCWRCFCWCFYQCNLRA